MVLGQGGFWGVAEFLGPTLMRMVRQREKLGCHTLATRPHPVWEGALELVCLSELSHFASRRAHLWDPAMGISRDGGMASPWERPLSLAESNSQRHIQLSTISYRHNQQLAGRVTSVLTWRQSPCHGIRQPSSLYQFLNTIFSFMFTRWFSLWISNSFLKSFSQLSRYSHLAFGVYFSTESSASLYKQVGLSAHAHLPRAVSVWTLELLSPGQTGRIDQPLAKQSARFPQPAFPFLYRLPMPSPSEAWHNQASLITTLLGYCWWQMLSLLPVTATHRVSWALVDVFPVQLSLMSPQSHLGLASIRGWQVNIPPDASSQFTLASAAKYNKKLTKILWFPGLVVSQNQGRGMVDVDSILRSLLWFTVLYNWMGRSRRVMDRWPSKWQLWRL